MLRELIMKNKKIGWKVYSVIFSLLLLFAYYDFISKGITIYDFADIVISLTALTGLLGYSFSKKIHSQTLWRIWLLVIVIWDLFYNLYLTAILGVAQGVSQGGENVTIVEMLIAFIFTFPEYVALYLYGYKSTALWENKSNP
jgi:hypothetical protein